MALPRALEARLFYQSAWQRLEDAEYLLGAKRTTGAIYLAGYAVECMLKALLIATTPKGQRRAIVESFRGAKAHDFDWLKAAYLRAGGPPLPANILQAFGMVNRWTTVLRYRARAIELAEARVFFTAVRQITEWANGRI